jgi:hypothetical protein
MLKEKNKKIYTYFESIYTAFEINLVNKIEKIYKDIFSVFDC